MTGVPFTDGRERWFDRSEDVMGGALVVRGTRIPVSAIKAFHNNGYTPAGIAAEYPWLPISAIEAAIAYDGDD